MTHGSDLALYNTALREDDDTFLARFVARTDLADFLLRQLSHVASGQAAEHQIIVGARGMGKTSLLRRIAIGIAADPALAATFAPMTFREEQYNVLGLDGFWRNCGEALAEWCEGAGMADMADQLDAQVASTAWREADVAAEGFLNACRALDRRPVLLVDNLDLILDALSDQENWTLRRVLQTPGGPVLFGAATRFLDQAGDRKAPFYEFFRPHHLGPLDEPEVANCMRALSDSRGEAGQRVRAALASDPARLRTLHRLTGGNPRVLVLIYRLLEGAESRTVFEDLEVLLDQMTPFYKSRIEEYQTKLQRAVIDAVALNWNPITTHDLGAATGVAVTTLSSQLIRLRNDGLIEEVETSGARSGYQLIERFFNIWYLMRHGTRRTRQRIRWLVEFLRGFYQPEELRTMNLAAAKMTGMDALHPLHRQALAAAVEWGEERGLVLHCAKGQMGRPDDEIAAYDEVIARYSDADELSLREQVARALVNKGVALGRMGRLDEALAVFDEVAARYSDADDLSFREDVARALFNKGVALGQMGRPDEAIASYDEVVARYSDAGDLSLREQVAWALVNKGVALSQMGRPDEAIASYDEVVARYSDADELSLREEVARALFSKGFALSRMGRPDEAIASYDEVVARSSDAGDPSLRERVARVLVNKGVALGQMGRPDEEIASYDEVVARYSGAGDLSLREQVAWALVNKAVALSQMGRPDEAIASYDEVVARYSDADDLSLREEVARALVNKAVALSQMGRPDEAIASYDEVVARYSDAGAPSLREEVARALVNMGNTLGETGRLNKALAVFDVVIARFFDATELSLREGAARALVSKGNILADHSVSVEEAEAAYRQARAVHTNVFAVPNLAWLYLMTGRPDEGLALRGSFEALPPVGLDLFDAALALANDNFGTAVERLAAALNGDRSELDTTFSDDLLRLLRLAHQRGYGDKLIHWLEDSGFAERFAPVHAAFIAFVRGERLLLDVNPEVRDPARKIFDQLDRSRRPFGAPAPTDEPPVRKRGRPRVAKR